MKLAVSGNAIRRGDEEIAQRHYLKSRLQSRFFVRLEIKQRKQ